METDKRMNIFAIVMAILAMILAGLCFYLWHHKEPPEKIEVATPEQVKNPYYLTNHFQIPETQAKETVKIIERAQTGTVKPAAEFKVIADTSKDAAEQVKTRIEKKDETLPKAAIEKSDKTIVAEQPENKEHDVGVYKINLRKDHKVKVGAVYADDKLYYSLGYQNRRMEYQLFMDGKNIKGGAITYTVAEW